jgi:hypothetical protein
MGFSTVGIQWILRWRSTAFMVYLRNIAILAYPAEPGVGSGNGPSIPVIPFLSKI